VSSLQMPMSTSRGFRQRGGRLSRTAGRGVAESIAATFPALLAMSLGLLFATTVGAKTLKIATLMPEGSGFVSEMRQAGNNIEERTEGRVKFKFYPGGVMGNDKTVMRKMRVGQLHGAALPSGPLASIYPDIEVYSLPLLFRDYDEVEYVRARLDDQLKAGLAKAGFTALAISDGGFAYLLSQTSISRVEDLAKTKIWIPEDDIMSQTALEIAGVSPIPLPTADVYTALQTGLIDTVAAPPMGAIAFQWHTKVRTMTNVPLMYLIGIFTIDRKTFEKLNPGDQDIVREEVANASRRLDAETRLGDANAMEALKNQGIEMVMASSPAEVERWHDISVRATERLRGMNRYSENLLDQIVEYVEAYRAQRAPASPGADGQTVPAPASVEPK
jgi:TRAP-type C4-dicarboxylate transport system substrate-binding protein